MKPRAARAAAGRRVTDEHAVLSLQDALLAWYDRNRRRLPWRALPGECADPYAVWLSEVMLQQTTVKSVIPYFEKFMARWPDFHSLAAASLNEVLAAWAGLGYYARARNLHRCAQTVVERHGGRMPDSEAMLRALPGIGSYTAAAIAAIAFDRRAAPVDGNIERIVSRLFAVEEPLPDSKRRIGALAASLTPVHRAGDFAQALMDLGASICSPRRPACPDCPLATRCLAAKADIAEQLPRKRAKAAGALRLGAAFVAERADGKILLRTRPAEGLLGGMAEVPTSAWTPDFDVANALQEAPIRLQADGDAGWRRLPGTVRHVFTHFPLELVVFAARLPAGSRAPRGARWAPPDGRNGEALPTLMGKVIHHWKSAAPEN